jgi:hypothetical protein
MFYASSPIPTAVIAGLVPAIPIPGLRNLIVKIAPRVIFLSDKAGFVNPRPMLDVLFTLNCLISGIVNFKVNELFDSVSFRMARHQSILVLVDTTDKIIRDSNIDRAAWATCKNIDVELPHGLSFVNRGRRDKPGDDSGVCGKT